MRHPITHAKTPFLWRISPLRYPGGKSHLAPLMWELAEGRTIWMEVFAGGAGCGMTLLHSGVIDELRMVEKNDALAALWQSILADPDFPTRVETTTPTLEMFLAARDDIRTIEQGGNVPHDQLAFSAFIMNRCGHSGIVKSDASAKGGLGQNGKYSVATRYNGTDLARRIRRIQRWASDGRITFIHGDAVEEIQQLGRDQNRHSTTIFADPPYIGIGHRLYAEHGDLHADLAQALHSCDSRWLLTYDAHPDVLDLYPDHRIYSLDARNLATNAKQTEWLLISDDAPAPEQAVVIREPMLTAA